MSDQNPPDHRSHLRWVNDHLMQVFGSDPEFGRVVAFVAGFDAATGYSLLRGFQEWLVVKVGDGHEVHWMGLVEQVAREEGTQAGRVFELVDEFLADVDDRDGRRVLYRQFDQLRRDYLSGC